MYDNLIKGHWIVQEGGIDSVKEKFDSMKHNNVSFCLQLMT